MGVLIQFPVKPRVALTKRTLGLALGRSTRWVEKRTAEGMPASRTRNGERRYFLVEVLEWLDERETG